MGWRQLPALGALLLGACAVAPPGGGAAGGAAAGDAYGAANSVAGVAGVAGVRRALADGIIHRSESVAVIITGNGLKDIQSAICAAGQPISIAPDMAEVRQVLHH